MKTIARILALGSLLSLVAACGGDGDSEITAVEVENGVWADVGHGDALRVEGDVRTERRGHTLHVIPEKGKDGVALVKVPFYVRDVRTRGNAEVVVRPMRIDHLGLDAAGTSKITVTGVSTELGILARGNAEIDATGMNASHVRIDASGSSHTAVYVTESVSGSVRGSAELVLTGDGDVDATGLSADGSANVVIQ